MRTHYVRVTSASPGQAGCRPSSFFEAWARAGRWGFSPRGVEELRELRAGGAHGRLRFVVLLDAVDELQDAHRTRNLVQSNRLCERWGARVVSSARTELFQGRKDYAWRFQAQPAQGARHGSRRAFLRAAAADTYHRQAFAGISRKGSSYALCSVRR